MLKDVIWSSQLKKEETITYVQLKAVQTILTKGGEITDHKQEAWLAFDIAISTPNNYVQQN